jgi:hypothetical protein
MFQRKVTEKTVRKKTLSVFDIAVAVVIVI